MRSDKATKFQTRHLTPDDLIALDESMRNVVLHADTVAQIESEHESCQMKLHMATLVAKISQEYGTKSGNLLRKENVVSAKALLTAAPLQKKS